ncbi:MAG: response regulator transcription factor, partial [Planctomycetes bacterium]|nr:response regulator transcription factor [Planctomycetota bacterium]
MTVVSAEPIEIAIVEDQERLRAGLCALLAGAADFRVSGAFESMERALPALEREPPAILLADIGLPGMNGIEGVRRLRARHPGVLALMLTVHADDERVFEAVCAGASGYLLKDTPPERLVEALRDLGRERRAAARDGAPLDGARAGGAPGVDRGP